MKNRILALILAVMTVVSALAFCVSAETAEQTQTNEPVGYDAALVESLMAKAEKQANACIDEFENAYYEAELIVACISGQHVDADRLRKQARAKLIEQFRAANAFEEPLEYNGKTYTELDMDDAGCVEAYMAAVRKFTAETCFICSLLREFDRLASEKLEQWIQQSAAEKKSVFLNGVKLILPFNHKTLEDYEEEATRYGYENALWEGWFCLFGFDPVVRDGKTYTIIDIDKPELFDVLKETVYEEGYKFFYQKLVDIYSARFPALLDVLPV